MVAGALRLIRRSLACRGVGGTVALIVQRGFNRRIWSPFWRVDEPGEFDGNFGTDTGATFIQSEGLDITSPNWIYATRYRPTPAAKLHEMLAALPIRYEEFTFIDFGSGKGKVLLLASDLPFKAIIGLEFSEHLHQVAQRNLAYYRSEKQVCQRIECVLIDATMYDVPPEPTVCYFFNPFREPVMAQVVRRLEASLDAVPREMFIVYYRPLFHHLLSTSKYFREFRANEEYAIYKSTVGGL